MVGIDASDDAGIYKITDEIALVQTLDFFTPIVNNPYDFGRIAAANALSDVYAMGGIPLTAMNIVCFPINEMDKSILHLILKGGHELVNEADATIVGGHSIEDPELKYGLSVTGIVHPERFLSNAGAQPGDLLILTKPLGTGILATALKADMLDEKTSRQLTNLMVTLNKNGAEAMMKVGVNACTDITGFGLLGHCLEMAQASNVEIRIDTSKVPIIPEAETFASMGLVPGGCYVNQEFLSQYIKIAPSVEPILKDIISDPQTSGGLLISVPEEKAPYLLQELKERNTLSASIIGQVVKKSSRAIYCY